MLMKIADIFLFQRQIKIFGIRSLRKIKKEIMKSSNIIRKNAGEFV